MTARLIVGLVAGVLIPICGMTATFNTFEAVDKVNEKLPKDQQFDHAWWYVSKYQRLHHEYKRLYPEGRALFKFRIATALGFACLLICGWGFGIFTR
ncbi:MAG: hypothetical protein WBS17_17865 [Candidatus Acidiferrales bacterium]